MRRALVLALVALVHCKPPHNDLAELGLGGASSDPLPGIVLPVRAGDLAAVSQRGRLIAQMDRALRLAYEDGVTRVGVDIPATALPLVDIDPGGASAQVLFVQWPRGAHVLAAEEAERWLLVALLMNPDRVLDVELVSGKLDGWDLQRVHTMLVAAKGAAHTAPGAMFHMLDVTEREDPRNEHSALQGRVYALSADGDGPDLDILVATTGGKHRELEVRSTTTVHAAGLGISDPIVTTLPMPAPISVARALLRGPEAGEVIVQAGDRSRWSVSARTGKITAPTIGGAPPSEGAAPPTEGAAAPTEGAAPPTADGTDAPP